MFGKQTCYQHNNALSTIFKIYYFYTKNISLLFQRTASKKPQIYFKYNLQWKYQIQQ